MIFVSEVSGYLSVFFLSQKAEPTRMNTVIPTKIPITVIGKIEDLESYLDQRHLTETSRLN